MPTGVYERKIPSSRKMTPNRLEAIIACYEEGKTQKEVGAIFGMNQPRVNAILKKEGVIRRANKRRTVYRCNHDFFFDVATNERAAYWAGFIAADGCVWMQNGKTPVIDINLASVDHQHLVRLTMHLKSNHPVKSRARADAKCGAMSSLKIASPRLAEGLLLAGVAPRKTFTQPWPNLPPEMLRHFLRGIFDGDGCWSLSRSQAMFQITGNTEFLKDAQSFLIAQLSLGLTKIAPHQFSKGIGNLVYGGNRQCSRIAQFLYEGASVYLPRKFEKVKHLLPAGTLVNDLEDVSSQMNLW